MSVDHRQCHTLIDHVVPDVPVRQWVLSLPYRLRYLLAWDHELCRAVTGVAVRTVLGFLRRRARRDGIPDGRSGAVAIVQRFGGALNLNVHLHTLVLDGVFAVDGNLVAFHPTRRLTREDVAGVVALIARRVERLLERRELAIGAESGGAPDLGRRRRRSSPRWRPGSPHDHAAVLMASMRLSHSATWFQLAKVRLTIFSQKICDPSLAAGRLTP